MQSFSERIGSISEKTRSEIPSITIPMINHLASVLHSSSSVPMQVACLQTLRAITSSASEEEARRLTAVLPVLLNFENLRNVSEELLHTLDLSM